MDLLATVPAMLAKTSWPVGLGGFPFEGLDSLRRSHSADEFVETCHPNVNNQTNKQTNKQTNTTTTTTTTTVNIGMSNPYCFQAA